MAKFHKLKVAEVRRETADAVSVKFDLPSDVAAEYKFTQGQYLTLKMILAGEDIRRSYSICTSPLDNELRVAIKEVNGGKMSTFINRELKAGSELEVMTPMGNFFSKVEANQTKKYVLFAGGSGITPILSILKTVLGTEKSSTITLVYANRDEASVIFKAEIEALVGANSSRINYVNIYDAPAAQMADIYKGFITPEKIVAIAENHPILNADEYFICGPGPMMESVKQGLEKLQIKKEKIHIEYFSAVIEAVEKASAPKADNNAVVDAEITVIQYGIETTLKLNTKGKSILDAALAADVDVPFACKGAVCCTCRAKVLEGQVKMDANFALTEDEVAEGFILTCQAHPLTEKVVVDYDAV